MLQYYKVHNGISQYIKAGKAFYFLVSMPLFVLGKYSSSIQFNLPMFRINLENTENRFKTM